MATRLSELQRLHTANCWVAAMFKKVDLDKTLKSSVLKESLPLKRILENGVLQ